MGWESPSHWLIIAILVIALFGYKKLPDAARSLGRSLRIFKTEVKGMTEDDKAREDAKAQSQLEPEPPAVALPSVPPAAPSAVISPPSPIESASAHPTSAHPTSAHTTSAHTTANASSDKPTTSVE